MRDLKFQAEGEMHIAAVCSSVKSVSLYVNFCTCSPPTPLPRILPSPGLYSPTMWSKFNRHFGQVNLDHLHGKFQTEENNEFTQTYILKIEKAGLLLYRKAFKVISTQAFILTHCGRVTQIYVFNTVKLGTSASSP